MLKSNSASNNNSLFLQNQHWQEKSFSPLTDFIKNAEHFLNTLYNSAPKTFAVLAYLAEQNNCYKKINVSQEAISVRLNMSRKQVNRAMKLFQEQGIVTKINRGYKKSCVYELHHFFYDPGFRDSMWHLFKAFRWTPKNPDVLLKFQLINKRNTNNRYKFSIRNVPLSLTRREKDITIYPDYLDSSCARGDLIQEKKHKNRENILFVKNPWLKRSYGPMKQFTQREYEGTPVPPYIKAITEIPLSKWGQIKLTCFPEEAIADARRKITLFPNTRNPYSFFWLAAKDYCKANNIVPDMRWLDKLCESHHVPADANMLLGGPKDDLDNYVLRDMNRLAYRAPKGYKNNQEDTKAMRAAIEERHKRRYERESAEHKSRQDDADKSRASAKEFAEQSPDTLLSLWENEWNKRFEDETVKRMFNALGQLSLTPDLTGGFGFYDTMILTLREALINNYFSAEVYERLYATYPRLQHRIQLERGSLKRGEGKGNTTSNITAGTFGSLSSQIQGIMHNKVNE